MDPRIVRFWSYVQRGRANECWLWQRGIDKNGYGKFTAAGGRSVRSHRFAYEVTVGTIPLGKCVLHTCDIEGCCNPGHLWVGTNADNMRDKMNKGRSVGAHRGTEHHNAKLTPEIVIEMRRQKKNGATTSAMARLYGVCFQVAKHAINGVTWKHVAMP